MDNYMYLVPVAAVVALLFAAYLANKVSKMDAGTDRMKEIADAIAEGARVLVLPVSVCVSASAPSADLLSFRQPHSTSVQCQRLHLPLPQEPFLQKTFYFSPFSMIGGLGFSPKCVWISKRYACKTSSTDFHRLPHAESIMLPFL